MAIIINNEKYLSYEEQVEKNKEDIKELKEEIDNVIDTCGIITEKVVQIISGESALPIGTENNDNFILYGKDTKYKALKIEITCGNAAYFGIYGFPDWYDINSTDFNMGVTAFPINKNNNSTWEIGLDGYCKGSREALNYITLYIKNFDTVAKDPHYIWVVDTGHSLQISFYAEA